MESVSARIPIQVEECGTMSAGLGYLVHRVGFASLNQVQGSLERAARSEQFFQGLPSFQLSR